MSRCGSLPRGGPTPGAAGDEASSAPPGWLDDWTRAQDGLPIVYATLGTAHGRDTELARTVLGSLDGLDVATVMTVGHAGDPSALQPWPRLPQEAVLPRCAVVISHGGSGTVLGALAHGPPQVILPQGADQFINAERCVAAGCARSVAPGPVTTTAVRSALNDVLTRSAYRESAQRLQVEMTKGMSGRDVVELLERTVAADSTAR